MVKPFGSRGPTPDPTWGILKHHFSQLIFLLHVLCRFIQFTDIMTAFNYVWWLFSNYCGPNVFDIWLRTMIKTTRKILKLVWKTPGIFSS